MPREIVSLTVLRKTSTPDGTGGYSQIESAVTGSPFAARIYRRPIGNPDYVARQPGDSDADKSVVVSFMDPATPVQINDIVVLPDGTRARILRVRVYTLMAQCDVEVGVD